MLRIQKHIRKIYFRRKRNILDLSAEWLYDQSLPLEALKDKQLKKLNKLLNHAIENTDYYQNIFQNCGLIENGRIRLESLNDLSRAPFLTKKILRDNADNLHAKDSSKRKSFRNSSGGSTGAPVSLMQDLDYLIADEACLIQLKKWRGVDPFDNEIFIWGAERDTFEGKKPLKASINDFLRNRIMLNCFRMTPEDMRNYIELINRHKPKMIRAYVDAIYELACFADANKISITPQNLVHTGAGTLHDYMREKIETVFGCPVFNQYGGREVGHIASECGAHDGLHIQMEHNLIEVVNSDGTPCNPGESGEIVVTNLNNYSMPIIRYKIGDIGVLRNYEPCPCGCAYPKLEKVEGRVGDVFIAGDGRRVSPVFFAHLIGVVKNDGRVMKYQVIQKKIDHIVVKLENDGPLDSSLTEDIRAKIRSAIGEDCQIEFETVNHIRPTSTGKYRYAICEIDKDN